MKSHAYNARAACFVVVVVVVVVVVGGGVRESGQLGCCSALETCACQFVPPITSTTSLRVKCHPRPCPPSPGAADCIGVGFMII